MAKSALIEELEKQFNENPRRVFARLANEYRKAGELELAIDICRTHIPQQPSYISGYIVLGQALFERQDLDEAKSTFETALGLDPENLIALRQLGDIARVQGDADTARAWYHRLLEVDPQNEEAAAQLEALKPAEPEPAPPAAAGSPFDEFGWREIHPEDQAGAQAAEPEPEALVAERPAPELDSYPAWMNPDPPSAAAEGSQAPEEDPDKTPVVGVPAVTAETTLPPLMDVEDLADLNERSSGSDAVADAPTASTAPESAFGEMLDLDAPNEETHSEPAVEIREIEPEIPVAAAPVAETPSEFVTETMAELYLKQGFDSEALRIYRQLIVQRPDDATLRQKVEEIETRQYAAQAGLVSGPTIREFFTRIARMRAPLADTQSRSDSVPDEQATPLVATSGTNGQPDAGVDTVDYSASGDRTESIDIMDTLEIVTPAPAESAPEAPSAANIFNQPVSEADDEAARVLSSAFDQFLTENNGAPGNPAREASSELSLDAVFRDTSTAAQSPRVNGAVSFDDFFAEDGSATRARDEQTEDRGEGSASDLETFHAWLEGLKK